MKKALLLLTVAALLATPAFAGIRNTKHDLSSTSTATNNSTNYGEICVFCHTPHGAVTMAGVNAPLWNRTVAVATFAATDLYNSATLDQTNSAPTVVLGQVNASDARLCLTCHSGANLTTGLANPANAAAGAQPAGLTSLAGLELDLGANLTNDHPIGMDYGSVQTADTAGFKPETVANTNIGSLPLYGTTGVMWCSSCHDVHDGSKGTPFLNTSNAASGLCLVCHNK